MKCCYTTLSCRPPNSFEFFRLKESCNDLLNSNFAIIFFLYFLIIHQKNFFQYYYFEFLLMKDIHRIFFFSRKNLFRDNDRIFNSNYIFMVIIFFNLTLSHLIILLEIFRKIIMNFTVKSNHAKIHWNLLAER